MENNTNTAKERYIPINGQLIRLDLEQQKEWDRFINEVRNRARREGICGQPDYHLCFGDCERCRYRIQGMILSTDDERYGDGFSTGKNRAVHQPETPEETIIRKDKERNIYATAAKVVKNGDEILRMHAVEGMTTREIGKELGMPQRTVSYHVNKIISYLREHCSECLDF